MLGNHLRSQTTRRLHHTLCHAQWRDSKQLKLLHLLKSEAHRHNTSQKNQRKTEIDKGVTCTKHAKTFVRNAYKTKALKAPWHWHLGRWCHWSQNLKIVEEKNVLHSLPTEAKIWEEKGTKDLKYDINKDTKGRKNLSNTSHSMERSSR